MTLIADLVKPARPDFQRHAGLRPRTAISLCWRAYYFIGSTNRAFNRNS